MGVRFFMKRGENAPARKAPAVVVRADLNGLGVVRSLAGARIPAVVVDLSTNKPAMWSRGVTREVTPALHGRALLQTLINVSRRFDAKPVLFVTDEAAVMTVAEHRDELKGFYRFEDNPLHVVSMLENKARFHEFATSVDLPIPAGLVISCSADLGGLKHLSLPLTIKPAHKSHVYFGRTERIHVASTHDEARYICARLIETIDECVVQEWIPGPDSNIAFCLFYRGADPDFTTIFTGRKLLVTPPSIGSTGVCVSAPEWHRELKGLTRRFLEAADYRGLGSLEFKKNAATGRFEIIEPTVGRTDWQEEIATLCGVNLPLFAYAEATGERFPPAIQWRDAAWRASMSSFRPSANFGPRKIYDGFWRMSDPLPAAVFYSNAVAQRMGARVGAFLHSAPWVGHRRLQA